MNCLLCRPLLWITLPLLLAACGKNTEVATCHPQEGRFIAGEHYISSEMLTEDGNWDYTSMQRYFDRKAKFYPDKKCLPLKPPVSLKERLQEVSERIDMEN